MEVCPRGRRSNVVVLLVAFTPVVVCYMIKSSWDEDGSIRQNLKTMWRPPPEEDIKPHPSKEAPPAKVQSEKTDRWHVDPIAKICQRPRAAEPGLAGSDTCV
ncbi:hypothetical protein MCOR08_001222 [Pyricularia oryzae]|nr:hypothetical protein MCOR26_000568 [Pyricularia oryzae]KAI6367869.1 hypothetical protein MCOR32_007050 [Pyricularia oryzae]KAI6411869.1 hypothetical protein MCOR20_003935 [Pyricularia oryzae]KAI6490002.1 hypothetical protein MCOR11_007669 [Pyricularia oryzae]KAI6519460.1 hypothetical protein MCOR10_006656 [Pyricularia oryzae]